MSIQLLTAVKTAPAEAGAKNAASGDKPEGKLSFSAVLADRRQANSQSDSAADTSAANTARRPGQAASKRDAAPGVQAPQPLIDAKPDALKAGSRMGIDARTAPLSDTSSGELRATGGGETNKALTQAGRQGDAQPLDARTNDKAAADLRALDRGQAGDKALAAEPALDSAPARDGETPADSERTAEDDAIVFADMRGIGLALSVQQRGAGSAGAKADTGATRLAPATADVQLSLQTAGQAQADTPATDGHTRLLDARAPQAGDKNADNPLRFAVDRDGLAKQGEDALAGDRARMAAAAQNTPTDIRNPAAWAAFAGDTFQPGRGTRFMTAGSEGELSDKLDLKSLPAAAATVQGATSTSFAVSAQPGALAAHVQAPLGSEAWKQAVNQQALRLTHVGDGAAELTLYPRELGQLHVSLKMGEQAQLHFTSAHADVRAAVEAALPQLRHAFAESGINLGQTSVSDQGANPNSSNNNGNGRAQAGAGAADSGDVATTEALTAPVAVTTLAGRTLDGGIDIFA